MMLEQEINIIRDILNKELESKDLNHDEVLKLSRELDKLILEYYSENGNYKFDNEKISK